MNPLLQPLGWLALEAAVVVLAALAAQPLLRTAAARRSLWRAVLVALLAVLAAELTGIGSQLPAQLRLAWQTTFPAPVPPLIAPAPFIPAPAEPLPISDLPSPIPLEPFPEPLSFIPEPPAPPPPPSLPHSITPPPPAPWPAFLWLTGLAALLTRAAWTHAGFAWLRLRHFIPAAEALRQRVQALATRLGLRRHVRVLASERLRAPAAFGWVRPGVGVPGDFTARFAPAQQDVMLAHELAHLAARDPLWQLLADLAVAALWWHPLAWVARHQHRLAAELAADDASQALPDGPVVLAECLLALGHEAAAAPRAPLGMAGFRSQLGRRVERLLALPRRDWQAPSRARLALQTAVALLALAALALLPGCAANRTAGEAPSGIVAKWWQAKKAPAPVGDDVRSLQSNAERGTRNAESSQSLVTSAATNAPLFLPMPSLNPLDYAQSSAPTREELLELKVRVEAEIKEAAKRFRDSHPKMVALRRQLELVEALNQTQTPSFQQQVVKARLAHLAVIEQKLQNPNLTTGERLALSESATSWVPSSIPTPSSPPSLAERLEDAERLRKLLTFSQQRVLESLNQLVPPTDEDAQSSIPGPTNRTTNGLDISVGRQLFVDDFLIESNSLQRTWHQPVLFSTAPLLAVHNQLPPVNQFFESVWFEPTNQHFKLGLAHGVRFFRDFHSPSGTNWLALNSQSHSGPLVEQPHQRVTTDYESLRVTLSREAGADGIRFGFAHSGVDSLPQAGQPVIPLPAPTDGSRWTDMHPLRNGFLVVGRNLYFYFGGQVTNHGPPVSVPGFPQQQAAVGLATLRRDGFASLDAGPDGGVLTTKPVTFTGRFVFVNLKTNATDGELRVEILHPDGRPIEVSNNATAERSTPFSRANCIPLAADQTLMGVNWLNWTNGLASLVGRPVRFRFHLKNASLYSFWVGPSQLGRSMGRVAGGGPHFTNDVDTIGNRSYQPFPIVRTSNTALIPSQSTAVLAVGDYLKVEMSYTKASTNNTLQFRGSVASAGYVPIPRVTRAVFVAGKTIEEAQRMIGEQLVKDGYEAPRVTLTKVPLLLPSPPGSDFSLKSNAYQIRPGDELVVSVWGRDDLRTRGKVQADGSLLLPLVGAVAVGGKSMVEAREGIRTAYEPAHLASAYVSVMLARPTDPIPKGTYYPMLATMPDLVVLHPPTLEKLARIRLPQVSFDGMALPAVLASLEQIAARQHPPGAGVVFEIQKGLFVGDDPTLSKPGQTSPLRTNANGAVISVSTNPNAKLPRSRVHLNFDMDGVALNHLASLRDRTLLAALEVIVQAANYPIRYTIETNRVVFWQRPSNEPSPAPKLSAPKPGASLQPAPTQVAADVRRLAFPQTPDAIPQTPTASQSLVTSAATNVPAAKNWTPAQRAILQRLDAVVFPEVVYDGLPLPEVVKMLDADASRRDPAKQGFNFLLNSAAQPPEAPARVDLNTVLIKVTSVFRGLTLAQVLDLVCKTASEPIQFTVEDYGIVFTQRARARPFVAPRLVERPAGVWTPAQRALLQRLDTVVFPEITYDGLPLPEVVKFLEADGRKHDPEKRGFNFLLNSTGQPGDGANWVDLDVVLIHVNSVLRGLTLNQVLDVVCKSAEVRRPDGRSAGLQFTVEDYGIIFTPRDIAKPFVAPRRAEQPVGAAVRAKLDQTVIPQIAYDGIPLPEVLKMLAQDARRHDPARQGVNLLTTRFFPDPPPGWHGFPVGPDGKPLPRLLDAKGNPIGNALPPRVEPPDLDTVIINVPQVLNGLTLAQVLDVVCQTASRPITYRVEDYGVLITPKYPAPPAPKPGGGVPAPPAPVGDDVLGRARLPNADTTNLKTLAGRLVQAQVEATKLRADKGPQHPDTRANRLLIAALEQAIDDEKEFLAFLARVQPRSPDIETTLAIATLSRRHQALLEAKIEMAVKADDLGPQHPESKRLKAVMDELTRQVDDGKQKLQPSSPPKPGASLQPAPVAADVRRLQSNTEVGTRNAESSQSLLTSAATNKVAAPEPLQAAQEEALRRQERRLVLDKLLAEAKQFQKIKSWTNAVVRYEEGLLLAPPLNGPFGASVQVTDAIAGLNYCRLQLAIEHKQRSEFTQAVEQADKVLALDQANDFARLIKQLVDRVSKPAPSAVAVTVNSADQAKAQRLIASARLRLDQNNPRDALQNVWAALLTDPRSDADSSLLLLLLDKRYEDERVRLAATQSGRVGEVLKKWNEGTRPALPVPNPYYRTNSEVPFLTHSSKGAQRINRKLEEIVLPEVHFDAVPLAEVVKRLSEDAKKFDPEPDPKKKGLNLLINDVAPPAPLVDANGNPVPVARPVALSEGLIRISTQLRNLTLRQALDVICKNAELPTQFSVEEYAIAFIPRGPVAYYSRMFRVNPDTFIQGLQGVVGNPVLGVTPGGGNAAGATGQNQPATTTTTTGPVRATVPATVPATQRTAAEANALVRQFFQSAGVTGLGATNSSTRVFFNPENGLLVARGTTNALRLIEQAIQKVQPPTTLPPPSGPESSAPERDRPGRSGPDGTNALASATPSAPTKPLVKIETRIFERAEPFKNLTGVSLANTLRLDTPGLFTNQVVRASDIRRQFWPPLTTNQLPADGRMEVELYEAEMQLAVVMSAARREVLLKSLAGCREWSAPTLRTASGFRGQVQSVDINSVVVGQPNPDTMGKHVITVATGVTLDLLPTLTTDASALRLGYLADVREFLGYAPSSKNPPEAVPRFRLRQAIGTNTLAIGESLLLAVAATVPPSGKGPGAAPGGAERTLFVLLTATLDESAGAAPERDRPGRSSPASTNAPPALPANSLPKPSVHYRTNSEVPFLTHSSKGAQRINRKLDEIILPEIHFDSVSLPAVVTWLDGNVKKFDPEKKGLNFLINNVVSDYISPNDAKAGKPAAPVLDAKGNPIASPTVKPPRPDLENALIKVTRPIKDLTLRQVLDAICKTATVKMPDGRTAGLKFTIEEYAIVFSLKLPEQPDRFPRMFKVDPETFVRGLRSVEVEPEVAARAAQYGKALGTNLPALTAELNVMLRDYFRAAGVANLGSTNGPDATQVFFNDRNGLLLVRASLQDLDIIQQAIALLNEKPLQVLIEAKFVAVDQNDNKALGFDWFLGNTTVKPESKPATNRVVVIDREGNYQLDGRAGSLDQIVATLKEEHRANPNLVVRVRAAKDGRLDAAMLLLERCSRLGITNVSFATESVPEVERVPARPPSAANPTGVFPLPASPIAVPAATGIVTNTQVRTNRPALGTISGILTAPQFAVVMRALEQRDDASVKSLPKVTTPSGKQAVLELPAAAKAEGGFAQGLKVEVMPSVDANGYTLRVKIVVTRDGKKVVESDCVVWDAQTVMLGFPGAIGGATNRVPVLGDLPLAGRLFQPPAATNTPGRCLLFLTPTLVDSAGNRINTTRDEMPFAPAAPAKK